MNAELWLWVGVAMRLVAIGVMLSAVLSVLTVVDLQRRDRMTWIALGWAIVVIGLLVSRIVALLDPAVIVEASRAHHVTTLLQVPIACALIAPGRTKTIAATTAIAFLPLLGSGFVHGPTVAHTNAFGVPLTFASVGPLTFLLVPYGVSVSVLLARWARKSSLPDRDFVRKVLIGTGVLVVPAGANDVLFTMGVVKSVLLVDIACCFAVIGLLRAMTVRSVQAYERLFEAMEAQERALREGERDVRVGQKLADLGRIVEGALSRLEEPLASLTMRLSSVDATTKRIVATAEHPKMLEAQRLAEEAADGARKMQGTIAALHDFARPIDGDRVTCDLVRTIERALRVAQNDLSHRARVVTRFESRPDVSANPNRLVEAFVYLLVHAAASIPSDRWGSARITVEVLPGPDGTSRVRVSDEGATISEPELARLFDPYAVTTGAVDRSGLQLAMCHRIVTALGGRIAVEPADPGKVITVTLPKAGDVTRRRAIGE